MNDPEIAAIRAVIAKRVRSDDFMQRRRDIDARGLQYKLATDVKVEPVSANGVKSEWTRHPRLRRQQGSPVPARRRLCHRLARQPPAHDR